MGPGYVFDSWDFDWREIFIAETSALIFSPCECFLIEFEDMLCELDFFGPQEVVLVEVKGVEEFLCKLGSGCE